MTRKGLYALSAVLYIALMALITLPPITKLLDHVRPHILGIPFFQFFLIAVPVAMAIWLAIWFLWECKIEDAAGDKPADGEVQRDVK
jgi:hypothetical protein